MKVTEHLAKAKNPFFSVEIVPLARGAKFQRLYRAIENVMPYEPPFIDVTSHSAETVWIKNEDGTFNRTVKRKSPGTFGICAAIKYKFGVDPVPHILCSGFTREETEDALIELNYLGVDNVLAIRGDGTEKKFIPDGRSVNTTALDLVRQVVDMNKGIYLDEIEEPQPSDFCVGVTAYPEKHFQAPNLPFDINVLLEKQKAGAEYAVTQMFFDNQKFYDFKKQARAAGVKIPIIPGLKILATKNHLNVIPSIFHTDFPKELSDRLVAAKDNKEALKVGIDWAEKQALDLLQNGEPSVHFYVMLNTKPYTTLMERMKKKM